MNSIERLIFLSGRSFFWSIRLILYIYLPENNTIHFNSSNMKATNHLLVGKLYRLTISPIRTIFSCMHIKSVLLFLLLILGVVHTISAQKTDKKLTRQIAQIMNGFHGQVGIYVHDLHQNKVVQILADTVFPTASMVKIPIMIMPDKMYIIIFTTWI